jgi:hypothetical protein
MIRARPPPPTALVGLASPVRGFLCPRLAALVAEIAAMTDGLRESPAPLRVPTASASYQSVRS